MIPADYDQACENQAEAMATEWGALFRRLLANGFRRKEALLLLQTYIHTASQCEFDDDE